jgi:hypothetical protein
MVRSEGCFSVCHLTWIQMEKIQVRRKFSVLLVYYYLLQVFLLVYINCTKGFHCDISIHAYKVHWTNLPLYYSLIPLPTSPPHFFFIVLMAFTVLFSYMHRSCTARFLPALCTFCSFISLSILKMNSVLQYSYFIYYHFEKLSFSAHGLSACGSLGRPFFPM